MKKILSLFAIMAVLAMGFCFLHSLILYFLTVNYSLLSH